MPFPHAFGMTLVDQRGDVPNDPATYLWASIQGPDANFTTTSLRLDDVIGNNNGSLVAGLNTKDFSKNARNVKLLDNNNSVVSSAAS
jgi:hypothetical protein